jgi:hypothetical protein
VVSIYPCDIHGQRIRGALESFRLTLLRDNSRFSRRLRVCPNDLDSVLGSHDNEWEYVSDEGLQSQQGMFCARCAETPREARLVSAFVYVWRRSAPLAEYYGQYCDNCAQQLIDEFKLVEESLP